MKMRLNCSVLLVIGAALAFCGRAQALTILINVDEAGHGMLSNSNGFSAALPFALEPDPGPGGLPLALTYGLLNPPGLVTGDLLLVEQGTAGLVSDQLRFNPTNGGSLVVYSQNRSGSTSLADTGFPTALYANTLALVETGVEPGPNGITYTPTSGQPGFVAGAGGPVTYQFVSDPKPVPVPRPALGVLVLLGGLGAWRLVRRSAIGS